jgi:hypothetical protein
MASNIDANVAALSTRMMSANFRPIQRGREKLIRLTLYGTDGCHLCEEAEFLLSQAIQTQHAEIPVEIVDIAGKCELEDRYGSRIPVLCDAVSGTELGWPFDAQQLGEFLRRIS